MFQEKWERARSFMAMKNIVHQLFPSFPWPAWSLKAFAKVWPAWACLYPQPGAEVGVKPCPGHGHWAVGEEPMYVSVGRSTGLTPTIALGDELVLFAGLLQGSALDSGEPGWRTNERVERLTGRQDFQPIPPNQGSLTLFRRPASLSPAV